MTRAEAATELEPYVRQLGPYQGVSHFCAWLLLGSSRCEELLADRNRGLGPTPGYVYPWNVLDYMAPAQKAVK